MTSEFERIYTEHYPRLYRVAMKMLHDEDLARDVVQEVFVAFYLALENGREIKDVKNWLLRAAINKSIDNFHRNERFTKMYILNKKADNGTSPEQYAENAAIRMIIDKLDTRDKSLIVLYSEGYSYKEIAEITGIRFNSVGKMLARSVEKIKEFVKT